MASLRPIAFCGKGSIGKSTTSQNTIAALLPSGKRSSSSAAIPDSTRLILNAQGAGRGTAPCGNQRLVENLNSRTCLRTAAEASRACSRVDRNMMCPFTQLHFQRNISYD
ncbi:hypothetical protein ACDY96_19905 [Rhizobium mongolense]|uniref:hypothetical protein n=1 Tax=Rhizobium mongolense TaxID=57676 RepID=UPI0035590E45